MPAMTKEQREEYSSTRAKAVEEKRLAKVDSTVTGLEPVKVRSATERGSRKQRGVFNGTKGKLTIDPAIVNGYIDAGWHLHIFNDDGNRVQEALNNGYEFVTRDEIGNSLVDNVIPTNNDLGEKVRFLVGRNDDGNGVFAYLMKIPTVWWEEDQKELQNRPDLIDKAIRSGRNNKEGFSNDNFYNAGIQLTN